MSDTSDAKEQEIQGEKSESSELRRQLNAQRLRADTAERERNEALNNPNNVFKKMCDLAIEQRNEAERKLASAEQRIANHESTLRHFANCADVRQVGTSAMDYVAALNQKSEGESHE